MSKETTQSETPAPQTNLEGLEKVFEIAESAFELAQYASYAEIVGALSHNRRQVRDGCDTIFRLNRELDADLDKAEAPMFSDDGLWKNAVQRLRSLIPSPAPNLRVVWTCHNNLANGYFGGAVADDENGVVRDFAQQTWVSADIPLYAEPPPRRKEVGDADREGAMKDGYAQALATYQPTKLIAAIRAAEEEFNRISCEGVTETRSVVDALDRAKAFAGRGAIACRAALASEGPAE